MNREQFLTTLIKYGNIPYIWGGSSMDGLDCSGFAQMALAEIQLDPPGDQSAQALHDYFMKHGAETKDPDLGCLAFYGKEGRITHVGICLDSSRMIEAGGGGPDCTTVAKAQAKGAKIRVSQLLRRSDLVRVVRPAGLPWPVGGTTDEK